MAVPTLDELHRPVLEIANSSSHRLTRKEFVERLTDVFSLGGVVKTVEGW